MKRSTTTLRKTGLAIAVAVATLLGAGVQHSSAQSTKFSEESPKGDPTSKSGRPGEPLFPSTSRSGKTSKDVPSNSDDYFGYRAPFYRPFGRRIAKIDLDGDFNYDGVIDNDDPTDNGSFQHTPPGLIVGTGEMTKVILRFKPYTIRYKGQAVVSLSVDGINREEKSGKFESLEQEIANTGRIRVWRDASKSALLLDSADPERRVFQWVIADFQFPANLPGILPRTLYVEGVAPSGRYIGDVRLLFLVQHMKEGGKAGNVMDTHHPLIGGHPFERERQLKDREPTGLFDTGYDHIILTVQEVPQRKDIVESSSDVWVTPRGSTK